jgi:hypothetical protein
VLPAGPVAPFPGHEASPGSADFVKGPTPPGGAAAAEAPAGDDVSSEGESSAGNKPSGPDLSAMLPTYDQLPAGEAGLTSKH